MSTPMPKELRVPDAFDVPNPTIIRARELIQLLRASTGPEPALDRQIAQLYLVHTMAFTQFIDDAKRLVPKYYQIGFRQYKDGSWGAYVEVNATEKQGFIWANHKCEPHALLIATLEVRIAEMT